MDPIYIILWFERGLFPLSISGSYSDLCHTAFSASYLIPLATLEGIYLINHIKLKITSYIILIKFS